MEKGGNWVRRVQGRLGVAQCAVVLAGFTLVVWRTGPVIKVGFAVWACFVGVLSKRERFLRHLTVSAWTSLLITPRCRNGSARDRYHIVSHLILLLLDIDRVIPLSSGICLYIVATNVRIEYNNRGQQRTVAAYIASHSSSPSPITSRKSKRLMCSSFLCISQLC